MLNSSSDSKGLDTWITDSGARNGYYLSIYVTLVYLIFPSHPIILEYVTTMQHIQLFLYSYLDKLLFTLFLLLFKHRHNQYCNYFYAVLV